MTHAAPEYRVQEPSLSFETEPKVKASSTAAGAAGVIAPLIVRVVDDLLYGGGAIDVPFEYQAAIGGAVAFLAARWAGWYAPHVERIRTRIGV